MHDWQWTVAALALFIAEMFVPGLRGVVTAANNKQRPATPTATPPARS